MGAHLFVDLFKSQIQRSNLKKKSVILKSRETVILKHSSEEVHISGLRAHTHTHTLERIIPLASRSTDIQTTIFIAQL